MKSVGAEFFILLFFMMAILKPLILKQCALKLDHRTVPIFVSTYLVLGIILTLPLFHDLMREGLAQLWQSKLVFTLCILKGLIFWFATYHGQKLTQHSLSSARFVLPPALAISAIINSFLGENLTQYEWIGVMGMAAIGIAFFLHGHLQDLIRDLKKTYLLLVAILVSMIVIDHYTISHSNWYVLLFISNLTLFIFCVGLRKPLSIWRSALTDKTAALGGLAMVVFEFSKFYPMVTLVPVSVISAIQAATIPIVLVLTAVLWKERTWQEQLMWGLLSMALFMLFFI